MGDGYHLSLSHLRDDSHPVQKATLKLLRVKTGKHPLKGVVRRYTVWQVKKLTKPIQLGVTKDLNVHPAVCSTNHGTNGHHDDVKQLMELGSLYSWIF